MSKIFQQYANQTTEEQGQHLLNVRTAPKTGAAYGLALAAKTQQHTPAEEPKTPAPR